MNDFLKYIAAIALVIFLVLFIGILGTLGGIVGGWIVGLFFSDLIIGMVARLGINTVGLEVWHIGGFLGFVGAFFKAVQLSTTK